MIRIERKMTEKAQRAIAFLGEAKRRNTTYNTPEVTAALREMFHGKCYICENRDITSWQIEHLRPHREEKNLKYDWDNLFLACAHCNNTKLAKYDPIIDCTKEDVEKLIAFRKKGYFGTEEELLFELLDFREETINTQGLLREVYYGSTPQKKMEAKILRRLLRKELAAFKEYVREYQRWLIRDHRENYPELFDYIQT